MFATDTPPALTRTLPLPTTVYNTQISCPAMALHRLTMALHRLTMALHRLTMALYRLTMALHRLTIALHRLTMLFLSFPYFV
ncbi:MAG: hypothetical protein V7K89_01110 [Nostoc sp.]|uniref:hypothetical protein n=1 Tax=Nostoc sp. TaxID=1180 RepID=UPI002FFC61CA